MSKNDNSKSKKDMLTYNEVKALLAAQYNAEFGKKRFPKQKNTKIHPIAMISNSTKPNLSEIPEQPVNWQVKPAFLLFPKVLNFIFNSFRSGDKFHM